MGNRHRHRYKKTFLMAKISGLCAPDRTHELKSNEPYRVNLYRLSFNDESGSFNIDPCWDRYEVDPITNFFKQKLGLKEGVTLRFSKDRRRCTLKIKCLS